jgi:hypothetical protein
MRTFAKTKVFGGLPHFTFLFYMIKKVEGSLGFTVPAVPNPAPSRHPDGIRMLKFVGHSKCKCLFLAVGPDGVNKRSV